MVLMAIEDLQDEEVDESLQEDFICIDKAGTTFGPWYEGGICCPLCGKQDQEWK
jgi:hypothetical protein